MDHFWTRRLRSFLIAGVALTLVSCEQIGFRDPGRAQLETVRDMRDIGVALMSWLTDQVSAPPAGQPQWIDLSEIPSISHAELQSLLVPRYIQELPETDGWGNPYEFHVNVEDLLADHVILIRSAGRDGRFSGRSYSFGAFPLTSYDEDVVWSDGYFIRWPES